MNASTTKTMNWLLTASILCLIIDFQTSMAASSSFVAGLRQRQQLSALRSSKFDKYGSRIPSSKESVAATADDGDSDAENVSDRLLAGYTSAGSRRDDNRRSSASQRRRDGRRQRPIPQRWTDEADDEKMATSVLRSLTHRGRPRTASNDDLAGRRLNQRLFTDGVSLDQPEAGRQLRSSSRYASDMDEIARTLSQSQSDLYAPEEDDEDEDDDERREEDDKDEEENTDPPRYLKGLSFNRQPQQGRYFNPLTRSPDNRLPGWFPIPPQKGKRPIANEGYSFNPLTRMMYRRPQQ